MFHSITQISNKAVDYVRHQKDNKIDTIEMRKIEK